MSRVFLEEADRPPPAYYQNNGSDEQKPLKIVPFQTPDPEKWISAPEFVPRSKQLADAFGFQTTDFDNQNYSETVAFEPSFYDYSLQNQFTPQPISMPPPAPFNGIPPGYTANMTTINPGNGPPIAAILLRKKRKRRSKHSTNSMVNTHSTSPCSSHPSDPNGDISSCDEFQKNSDAEQHNLSGSCPDLTAQQIQKWDDYLYETAKTVNKNGILHESTGERTSEDLSSSVYEIAAPGILDTAAQTISGTSNKELQKLDQEINGNIMTSSMVLRKLANHTFISDGCTEKTLEQEMNELTFRKPISQPRYGYPQIDNNVSPYVHLATMDPKKKKITNHLIDKDALKAYLDEEDEEEDFLEGLNITVNNFDNCEDLSLSDVEQPSRFQQFQEAIRKNTVVIATDLQAPDRQCCTIM